MSTREEIKQAIADTDHLIEQLKGQVEQSTVGVENQILLDAMDNGADQEEIAELRASFVYDDAAPASPVVQNGHAIGDHAPPDFDTAGSSGHAAPIPSVIGPGMPFHVENPVSPYAQKIQPQDLAWHVLGHHKLLNNRGAIYEWSGTHWREIAPAVLGSYVYTAAGHEHVTSQLIPAVSRLVMNHPTCVRDKVAWNSLGRPEVPFANGVLDIATGALRPHKPEDYIDKCLSHSWDPSAPPPNRWLRCFDEWFAGEPDAVEKIHAMQEFLGYILLNHADFKKALVLYGESNTGKSVVAHVIRAICGETVCAIKVDAFDDPRAAAPIVGCMVNLVSEISKDAVLADGGFKTLVSTTEPILIDPKNVKPYMYTPTCKHVFTTNNLPKVEDHSMGVFNRLLIVGFNRVFPEMEQDTALTGALTAELPGILRWAVAGAQRLLARNGKFTTPASSRALVEAYRRAQNPINEFVEERCVIDADEWIPDEEFKEAFISWLGGNRNFYTKNRITRLMAMANFKKRRQRVDGKPAWVYLGLRFIDARDSVGDEDVADKPY